MSNLDINDPTLSDTLPKIDYSCHCNQCNTDWTINTNDRESILCPVCSSSAESRPIQIYNSLLKRMDSFSAEEYLAYCGELLQVVPMHSVLDWELSIEDTPYHREELSYYRP